MVKTTIPKFLILVAVMISISDPAFADKRIQFQKGKSSATVTGSIAPGGRLCYFAGAREGQVLTAVVRSRSGKVVIFESGEKQYCYQVELSGDQSVCVDNLRGSTTYSLTVSIR